MIGETFLRRKDWEIFVKNLNRRLSSLGIIKPSDLGEDIAEFITLDDTPDTFTGKAENIPAVNATEDALEFKTNAEILAQLSGEATAAFDWNGQNLTGINYSDINNIADPGAPGANIARLFACNDHLIGLSSADIWHDLSAGAKGVSSCVHGAIVVAAEAGLSLNITWGAGKVFDALITGGSQIVDIAAQPVNQLCVASSINYLFYDHSGGVLALDTTGPDYTDGDFSVAHILTLHNDILMIFTRPICYESVHEIKHVLRHAAGAAITEGMLISEHGGAPAFDVDQSEGVMIYGGFEPIHGAAIDSTVTDIIRWYHNAADAWETDVNAQIDAAFWDDVDDGVAPIANIANKYYRSTFYTCGSHIHWVYPQVEYDNLRAALVAPDPTPPPALEKLPKTVTVVMKGDDAAFPIAGSDQWIDVRPMLGAGGGGGAISSHKNLGDLPWSGCGHTGTADRYIGFDNTGAAQERSFAQVVEDLSGQEGRILEGQVFS